MARQQIDFPVQQHKIATPAPPPAGSLKLYPKSDDILYKLNSAGVESAVGVIPDPLTIGTLSVTSTLTVGGTATVADVISSGTLRGVNVAATSNYYWRDGTTDRVLMTFGGENLYWGAGGGQHRWVNQNNSVQLMNLTTAGNLQISGTTTTTYVTTSGGINTSGRITMAVTNTTDIANTPGGTGPMEIGVPGGGAAMLAFHRHGYYAAHFGLDTDNTFKVGGWSMGAASYKLLDTRDQSTTYNVDVGVQRWAGGHISCIYIYMPSGAQGGSPTYIMGQNGDGWARWWPKSVMAATTQSSNAWQAITTGNGWQGDRIGMYANRTGYGHISCWVGTGTNGEGAYCALRLLRNGGVLVEGTGGNGSGGRTTNVHWVGQINNGEYFTVQPYVDNNKSHYNGACEFWITIGS